jgi:hypothetical protein
MFILEYKLKGKAKQYQAIDESIRTVQFILKLDIRDIVPQLEPTKKYVV